MVNGPVQHDGDGVYLGRFKNLRIKMLVRMVKMKTVMMVRIVMKIIMMVMLFTSGGLRISSSKPGGVALSTSIRAVADLQGDVVRNMSHQK